MKTIAILLFVAVAAAISGCNLYEEGATTGKTAVAKEKWFNYSLQFCSSGDCLQTATQLLGSAKSSVKCAFYAFDEKVISEIPDSASAEIVVDKEAKAADANLSFASVYKAKSRGIMHSKYCIIDDTAVMTGSFNPTLAAKKDYNNVIIINSTAIASFYSSNFEKLKHSSKNKTPTAAAVANRKPLRKAILNNTAVEVYFCPEDGCAEALIMELRNANQTILFAAYSFTHPRIADELIMKASEGIAVKGVIEKSTTNSEYSKHAAMMANGIKIRLESSKRLMHHKFFVIDNETVITGSFNPTQNGDERNDENMLIIRSRDVAAKYAKEFNAIGVIEKFMLPSQLRSA
ncbi:hypothetical protein HYU17_00895 [Candidatus Woesearchaeota archaeon]|nr:hypothetical protein [Candidatus Woesearchaeota archaeon]